MIAALVAGIAFGLLARIEETWLNDSTEEASATDLLEEPTEDLVPTEFAVYVNGEQKNISIGKSDFAYDGGGLVGWETSYPTQSTGGMSISYVGVLSKMDEEYWQYMSESDLDVFEEDFDSGAFSFDFSDTVVIEVPASCRLICTSYDQDDASYYVIGYFELPAGVHTLEEVPDFFEEEGFDNVYVEFALGI
ncbi:MAG: hypothetical protein J6V22_01350 [Clostridia bacterium]|nr:hypothetical protein [Clostridia bacterium]